MSPYVIAEAGVNHNGSVDRAIELVRAAAEAGADAVKFQTFQASELVTPQAPKADYQLASTDEAESQYDMIRRLELGRDDFRKLADACAGACIEFLSTAMDAASLEFLVAELGMARVKVGSGDLTNGPLLLAAARTGLPLIVSTGMATMQDVEDALDVIAAAERQGEPGTVAERRGNWRERKEALARRVTLLHCTTEYPAPLAEVNLRAMDHLAERFGLAVGYSDHTTGTTVAVAAAARGAVVIEKHFTLSRSLPGPDHAASLEPAELTAMVAAVHDVATALGAHDKVPGPSEARNARVARRSLVAACPIAAGEVFDRVNLAVRRPGLGISPIWYWDALGGRAGRDYAAGDLIAESDVPGAG